MSRAAPKASPSTDPTTLQTAVRFGCVQILRHFIEQGADIKGATLPSGQTLLTLAAEYGHRETAKALVEAGCDVNELDAHGYSPLFVAVVHQQTLVVKELVEAGARVDYFNEQFQISPLLVVASNGDIDTLRTLLTSPTCDLDIPGPQGQTALYTACELGYLHAVGLLLAEGADPDIPVNSSGNTALLAAIAPSLYVRALDNRNTSQVNAICRQLVRFGCDVDVKNFLGQTPLEASVDTQQAEVALTLLRADCEVNPSVWPTAEVDVYILSHDAGCPQLYQEFTQRSRHPSSLQRLCRQHVRDTLRGLLPFPSAIAKLPLPVSLRDFLCYKGI